MSAIPSSPMPTITPASPDDQPILPVKENPTPIGREQVGFVFSGGRMLASQGGAVMLVENLQVQLPRFRVNPDGYAVATEPPVTYKLGGAKPGTPEADALAGIKAVLQKLVKDKGR